MIGFMMWKLNMNLGSEAWSIGKRRWGWVGIWIPEWRRHESVRTLGGVAEGSGYPRRIPQW